MSQDTRKVSFPVFNGYAPQEGGPKAIPITLDFTATAEIDFDLIDEVARSTVDFVQCVWVDNSNNPNPLVLTFSQTGQALKVPANAQGIWPVIAPLGLRCAATTTQGAFKCQLIFLNVPMPMTQYGPVSIGVINVTANFTPLASAFVDHSGTVALGGTSQALLAANANAKRRIIQNPANNIESLWINFGGVAASAANSIEIPVGQEFDTGSGPIDQTAWTILGATTGHVYVCKESI